MVNKLFKSSVGIILLTVFFVFLSSFYLFFYKNPNHSEWDWFFPLAVVVGATLGMLVLPLIFIKYGLKENFTDFGFRFPEHKTKALVFAALAIIFLTPALVYFSTLTPFKDFYLLGEKARSGGYFLIVTIFSLIYYSSEEFLFRGFLFWGLWRKLKYHSFWLNGLIFAFFHLTKPPLEILFAFFVSFIFCFLSLKFRSFVPSALAHFGIALALNFLINFGF